jgi:hypothetical protein
MTEEVKKAHKPDSKVYRHFFRNLKDVDRYKYLLLGLPVPIKHRDTPFGYERRDGDEDWYWPIEEHLKLYYRAFEYTKISPFREIVAWLTHKSGRKISHEGLRKLFIVRPPLPELLLPYAERYRLASCTFENLPPLQEEAAEKAG